MSRTATSPGKRSYRMRERADAVERTRNAIVDAALSFPTPRRATLEAVAERAGVSRRTVLRHFGSREGLIAAAGEAARAEIVAQRFGVPVGDIEAIATALVEHYEAWGDRVYSTLLEEGTDPAVDGMLADGRALHREWVAEKLGPLRRGLRGQARERRLAALVAATDIFTWKLLRRDQGLSAAQTQMTIAETLRALDNRDRQGART